MPPIVTTTLLLLVSNTFMTFCVVLAFETSDDQAGFGDSDFCGDWRGWSIEICGARESDRGDRGNIGRAIEDSAGGDHDAGVHYFFGDVSGEPLKWQYGVGVTLVLAGAFVIYCFRRRAKT